MAVYSCCNFVMSPNERFDGPAWKSLLQHLPLDKDVSLLQFEKYCNWAEELVLCVEEELKLFLRYTFKPIKDISYFWFRLTTPWEVN